MNRIAAVLLLAACITASAAPAYARHHDNTAIGENSQAARKAAKQQQKYAKKQSKRQSKQMKRYQKQQKRASRNHR